jgi:hypothetical protein
MQKVKILKVHYGETIGEEGFESISLTVEANGRVIELPDCALNCEILLPLACVCDVTLPSVDENSCMPEYEGCDCVLDISEEGKVLGVYDLDCRPAMKR